MANFTHRRVGFRREKVESTGGSMFKKTDRMKRIFGETVGILLSCAVSGCIPHGGVEKLLDEQADSLTAVYATREMMVQDLFRSLDGVLTRMGESKTYGDSIRMLLGGTRCTQRVYGDIHRYLEEIGSRLLQCRNIIGRMEEYKPRYGTSVPEEAFDRVMTRLEEELDAVDEEMLELKTEIRAFVLKYGYVDATDALGSVAASGSFRIQDDVSHTAYWSLGSKRELLRKGLLKRPWYIWGKLRIDSSYPLSEFEKVHIGEFDHLEIDRPDAVVVSDHPSESYCLERDDEGHCIRLRIVDARQFWSKTKVLVVYYME